MRHNLTLQIYTSAVSAALASLYSFTKYDLFWLVFTLGGIFIMIGHQIFDRKIRHSFGKMMWMILTSFVACFFIKFLHAEGIISIMTMVVSTLIASMIAPAVVSIALTDLPAKVAEQVLSLPEWLFGILKRKYDKDDKS